MSVAIEMNLHRMESQSPVYFRLSLDVLRSILAMDDSSSATDVRSQCSRIALCLVLLPGICQTIHDATVVVRSATPNMVECLRATHNPILALNKYSYSNFSSQEMLQLLFERAVMPIEHRMNGLCSRIKTILSNRILTTYGQSLESANTW